MNIYVGSLSMGVNDEDLRETFEEFGQVDTIKIIKDGYTGESRGFAFIEMPVKAEATAAIEGLNGKEIKGRKIIVNEARPRAGRRGGGGGRGGRGGGGGRRSW